jgi:hypothetical protein
MKRKGERGDPYGATAPASKTSFLGVTFGALAFSIALASLKALSGEESESRNSIA